MTEKEIEEKANEIRKDEVARLLFCADVGITEDEFFINRNGDFEIEDMIRAFENGKETRNKILKEITDNNKKEVTKLEEEICMKDKRIADAEQLIKDLLGSENSCCEEEMFFEIVTSCHPVFVNDCGFYKVLCAYQVRGSCSRVFDNKFYFVMFCQVIKFIK